MPGEADSFRPAFEFVQAEEESIVVTEEYLTINKSIEICPIKLEFKTVLLATEILINHASRSESNC